MNNSENLFSGLEPFKIYFNHNRAKEALDAKSIKAYLVLFIVLFSFQSSAQYVPDTGGSFSGSVDFQQGLRAIKATGSSIIDPATITIRSTSGGSNWDTNTTWGNLDFHSNDGSGIGNTVRARIGSYMQSGVGGRSGLKFFTSYNDGLFERMVISTHGLVGIGRSNPLGLLHLSTGTTGGTVHANYDNLIIEQNSGNSGLTFLSNNSQNAGISFADDQSEIQGLITYLHNSDNMVFYTNGQERLRVNEDGNFGIGTTAPNAPLHIAQEDPSGLYFSRDNHDSYEFYLSGSNGLNIRNQTDARDEMVFLGNGNIGVGTSNPSELFTINQGSAASGLSIQRDGYDDYNLSLKGGKGMIIRNNSDSRDEMVFDGHGKVGIGTDSPAKELEVAGDLVLGKSGQSGKVHFRRSLDGGIRGFVGFTSGTNYQDIKICNETGGGWLTFLTNDGSSTQERMRVNGDGNVGIGTSAPNQKLSVNGKINAEEIILEDVAGADFVFEEDYDLRSLEETEQFIKANKHLPEVPSASEMAEDGLAIKEMNILLLQKVEELTLHLIRMEKEMTNQMNLSEQTNTELKARLLQQESKIEVLEAAQNND